MATEDKSRTALHSNLVAFSQRPTYCLKLQSIYQQLPTKVGEHVYYHTHGVTLFQVLV